MIILGITNDYTSGACLIKNNILKSCVSEERFTRKKLEKNWPTQSINYVLKDQNLKLEDIDQIVYGYSRGFKVEDDLLFYFDRIVYETKNNPKELEVFRERIEQEIIRGANIRKEFSDFVKKNKIEKKSISLRHHDCHGYSVYCLSKFKDSLIVTADGRGDFEATTVSHIKNGKKYNLYRSTTNDSLGYFYSRITKLLGFTPHRHEGKVTGLAARGNPKKLLRYMEKMIFYEKGKIYAVNGEFYKPFYEDGNNKKAWSKKALNIFKKHSKADIAAAAQKHLENLITKIVAFYMRKVNEKNLCIAGGVFANVLLNQKIRELKEVKNIFTLPHVGDEGLALGAAAGYNWIINKKKTKFKDLYLGPKFKLNKNSLEKKYNIKINKIKNTTNFMFDCLKENKVIGFLNDRMEFGARALCNRSIIYHSNDVTINDRLNKRLKRYEFMPFAPVTAVELAKKCYKGWQKSHLLSEFMTITYDCTNLMKKNSPAIIHVDNTARPQILRKEKNKIIHSLLLKWYKETGGLSLINTSFNVHEEPIVCSPDDAIKSFKKKMIDILIINDHQILNLD